MTAEEYAGRLARMIQCETVSPQGTHEAEFAKLRAVVAELFPLVHQRAERHSFDGDCWVYRLNGRDRDRSIALMSHHDVVAAGEGWAHPPFAGEIADGKLWGRGTVDTKTSLFAEFSALEELLAEGWEPPCNVFLASSHNEETGGNGIPAALAWFREQGITFEVVLDEGGAVVDSPISGVVKFQKCAGVAVHEKGRYRLNCTARADGTGFAFGTKNPVERMAAFIQVASSGKLFLRRLNPPMRAMLSALAPHCKLSLRLVLGNLWLTGRLLVRLLPRFSREAEELLGSTCAFYSVRGSGRVCSATGLFHPLDRGDLERDLDALERAAERYGVELVIDPTPGYRDPADVTSPAFAYTAECIRKVFPNCPVMPYTLPARTDGWWLSDICPCVLRFAPLRLSGQQLASVHSRDENIDLDAIADAVRFYREFLAGYR